MSVKELVVVVVSVAFIGAFFYQMGYSNGVTDEQAMVWGYPKVVWGDVKTDDELRMICGTPIDMHGCSTSTGLYTPSI